MDLIVLKSEEGMGIPFTLTFLYPGWGTLLTTCAQFYLGWAAATFRPEPLSDITIIITSRTAFQHFFGTKKSLFF